ncbi:very-long-chain 3-oxoacyl-CoA reductase-like isoform X1 [Clavelina lepadiformis]|uniref:very-long-chain 3-oxoacyl-CoA reductase-like isoform X1 n=2 Tax=Clavelina lepadiformis TaxID=159417 RepID=UPI00404274C4
MEFSSSLNCTGYNRRQSFVYLLDLSGFQQIWQVVSCNRVDRWHREKTSIQLQLVSRGQNIVLISRNEEKLRNVANEIESKHNVQTKCLTIDFSDDEEIYNKIADFLQGLDIGTLANNVGIAHEISCFHEHPNLSKFFRDIIRLSVISVIKVGNLAVSRMSIPVTCRAACQEQF